MAKIGSHVLKMERSGRRAPARLHETPLSADQRIEDLDAEHVMVTATVRSSIPISPPSGKMLRARLTQLQIQ
jgi:hypothetical protein